MREYEIRETYDMRQRFKGYKVICYETIPGADDRIITGTRIFDSEQEAAAYKEYRERQDQAAGGHFILF